jgi:hypothetical protein
MRDNFRPVGEESAKWTARRNGRILLVGFVALTLGAVFLREPARDGVVTGVIFALLAIGAWLYLRWGKS